MHHFGLDWGRDIDPFLELYFGEGMARLRDGDRSRLAVDGSNVALASLAKSKQAPRRRRIPLLRAGEVVSAVADRRGSTLCVPFPRSALG